MSWPCFVAAVQSERSMNKALIFLYCQLPVFSIDHAMIFLLVDYLQINYYVIHLHHQYDHTKIQRYSSVSNGVLSLSSTIIKLIIIIVIIILRYRDKVLLVMVCCHSVVIASN